MKKQRTTSTLHFDERLTREQLLKLLKRARTGKEGERDFLMILIGVSHGLRASEICDLRTDDFDLNECTVCVRRMKGSNETTLALLHKDEPLLDEYSAVKAYLQDKTGKLFNIKRGMLHILFRKYCADVGIPKRLSHPHVLKHSCAHFILESPDTDLLDV